MLKFPRMRLTYSERHIFFTIFICLSLDSKGATGQKSASFAILGKAEILGEKFLSFTRDR